jgi:hypothetical protein
MTVSHVSFKQASKLRKIKLTFKEKNGSLKTQKKGFVLRQMF